MRSLQASCDSRTVAWNEKLSALSLSIKEMVQDTVCGGKLAGSVKSYLSEVHGVLIQAFADIFTEYSTRLMLYTGGWFDIDERYDAKLDTDVLDELMAWFETSYSSFNDNIDNSIVRSINTISSISRVDRGSFTKPSSYEIYRNYASARTQLNDLRTTIRGYEESHLENDFASLDDMLANLEKFLLEVLACEDVAVIEYQPGNAAHTSLAFNNLVISMYNAEAQWPALQEQLAAAYAASISRAQIEAGEQQQVTSILAAAGGVFMIVAGIIALVPSGGTSTAVIVAGSGMIASGGVATAFATSEFFEAGDMIRLGNARNIVDSPYNWIRDGVLEPVLTRMYGADLAQEIKFGLYKDLKDINALIGSACSLGAGVFGSLAQAGAPLTWEAVARGIGVEVGKTYVQKVAAYGGGQAAGWIANKAGMNYTETQFLKAIAGTAGSMWAGRAADWAIQRYDLKNLVPRGQSVLDQNTIDNINSLPKGSKPDPSTYMTADQIDEHLALAAGGVCKIVAEVPPYANAGPPGGTFAMPTEVVKSAIALANGNPRVLEQLLTLDPGSLGDNPLVILMPSDGLRMPSGNEAGAWEGLWVPGGYTGGGIAEFVVDSPLVSDCTITPVFSPGSGSSFGNIVKEIAENYEEPN